MSSNNWMTVMDKMLHGISKEATSSLRDIKKCFDQEGRIFDGKFKKYFFQVSMNNLSGVYSNFEMELMLNTSHTENIVTDNEMNPKTTDTSTLHMDRIAGSSNRSTSEENSIHAVVVKSEGNEASADNMILILDSSDDEENSREHPLISTSQKVIAGGKAASANDVIMGREYGAMTPMNQNQNDNKSNDETASNNKKDDQTEVKKEASEPNKKETNDDDDIPLVLVQIGRPIPMKPSDDLLDVHPNGKIQAGGVSHNENDAAAIERASASVQDTNSHTVDDTLKNSIIAKKTIQTNVKAKAVVSVEMSSKVAKRHKCRFCEYSSNKCSQVKSHERIHTGEKPHRCRRCNKGFVQITHLKHHAKVHAKEFAFHCLGCFEGFSQKIEYDAHVKVCKTPRYECNICKKNSFVHKGHLKEHMRRHSGEKPFRCEVCLKRFSKRSNLNVHLNNIHNRIRH
ncbi:zinc finger protein 613-like isoform X1 [Sitodiplosis mosellana]|uniref:zinc finger protein 613-like isoform X1 n=1 Tax=Sitodiplosis mosellana TaxID=263140 RepID=UPI00244532F7|nr:zinc finger protein 613-like isoform X1 [Sitodiplosis mosellana]